MKSQYGEFKLLRNKPAIGQQQFREFLFEELEIMVTIPDLVICPDRRYFFPEPPSDREIIEQTFKVFEVCWVNF